MNSREFVYWLQGFLEISRTDSISVDQLKKIHEQLMLVDDTFKWSGGINNIIWGPESYGKSPISSCSGEYPTRVAGYLNFDRYSHIQGT